MSNLRDDWLAITGNASEEGDPIISCVFKTELISQLITLTQSNANLLIGPTVDYFKKKEKKAMIKFIKDETVLTNFDVYKSHTVHVPSGEPPGSLSRPPAKRKPGVVRPITQGKLLKAGAPDKKPQATSRPKPTPQPLPGGSANRQLPIVSSSAGNDKALPPAAPPRVHVPPPPPKRPEVPTYRAKFAFEGQEGEMSLKKDDIVELIEKDDNGWWLVKLNGHEGWAPNNYLELVQQSAPAPPAAPPPPRRAPVPKVDITPSTASATAKPVSVFPGMAPSNGAATPRKMTPSSSDSNSRPASKVPPLVAAKPKPLVGAKPSVVKPGIPAAPRPAPSNVKSSVTRPPAAPGQVDLAAALAKRAQRMANDD